MTDASYQLLDFGDGRKVESIAGYVVDRPSPAADGCRWGGRESSRGHDVDARFDLKTGWTFQRPVPPDWRVECGAFVMPIIARPYGHIGLFPEQRPNWDWLSSLRIGGRSGEPPTSLNLFAYTGAASIAMATAGFDVTHVDAARPNVTAAGEAVRLNESILGRRLTVRLIVEDAGKFVERCVRRGRRFDAIVMDPPAYGHDPKGRAWRIARDVWPMLRSTLSLLKPRGILLFTGHSPDVTETDVERFLGNGDHHPGDANMGSPRIVSGRLGLNCSTPHARPPATSQPRILDAGYFVRFERHG